MVPVRGFTSVAQVRRDSILSAMSHPLDGAYEQVRRAREHLEDLKPLISAFRETVENEISIKREPAVMTLPDGTKQRVVRGEFHGPLNYPAPPKISTVINETVQALRTALDYLIYELGCFDAKGIVDGTQFPIVDVEKNFPGEVTRHLRGLSQRHIAAIEALQPYRGVDWTRRLRDLSNPGKHRQPEPVRSPILITISPGSTDSILAGVSVNVKADAAAHVSFSDGTPIIECLEQLHTMVAKTLSDFYSEF